MIEKKLIKDYWMDIVGESADDISKSKKLTKENIFPLMIEDSRLRISAVETEYSTIDEIISVQLDLEQFKTDTEKRFNQMEEKIDHLRKEIKWAIGLVCSLIIMFGIIR